MPDPMPFDPHASKCYMSPELINETYWDIPLDGTKMRFRLSPELGDGISHLIVGTPHEVCGRIALWLHESLISGSLGDSVTVTLVTMTDAEFAALPEL